MSEGRSNIQLMKTTTAEYEFTRPLWARLQRIKSSDVTVTVGTTEYSTIPAELRSMNVVEKLGLPRGLKTFRDLPIYKYVKDNIDEVGSFIQFDVKSVYYPKAKLRRIIKRYLVEHATKNVEATQQN
jgi:hypothetical protein